ncbi:hypothetical protein DFH06DRAFT_1025940 [Mycena polygramma]|nr:hypothetical protein DFH06DRAFT_1025940 [Mycena polygramma]
MELTVGPDLLKRFAPRVHAYQRSQLDLLWERHAINSPFYGSAFTTAEFTFGNAALHTRCNINDVLHGLRVITILGTSTSCICVIPADNLAIRCPPGSTILIAAAKDYYFSTVAEGEKRYFFQQYFNAGIQRWIDRGFRSDADFDEETSTAVISSVRKKLANRVPFTMKLLSRLHEIHT